MLVFISDLHMPDGSTGEEQVLPTGAFKGTFVDLGAHSRNALANLDPADKEINIVFLGDVFDVIRSQTWFDFPPDERPWGRTPSEARAVQVFDLVVNHPVNKASFAELRSDFHVQFGFPKDAVIRKIYIPGNHDRLCNLYPTLRKRVVKTLGITHLDLDTPIDSVNLDDIPFRHFYMDLPHAAFARHGQEWDSFNFGGSDALSRAGTHGKAVWAPIPFADYMEIPIGDVIACEVASRLPVVVRKKLEVRNCSAADVEKVYKHFQGIFDVRPLGAMIPWLSYQLKRQDDANISAAINDAVQEVAHDFLQIPFVEEWLRRKDKWFNPLDDADKVELLCQALMTFRLTSLQPGVKLLERFAPLFPDTNHAPDALRDFQRLDSVAEWNNKVLYILYGHTHVPDQRAIDLCPPESPEADRVYINTGSWRPSFHQTITGSGFMTWKNLTYSIIYKPGENAEKGMRTTFPTFETWTGSLKEDAVIQV